MVAKPITLNQKDQPKAEIIKIETAVCASNMRWAKTNTFVEYKLSDGTADVGWYTIELIKDDSWKIASIAPSAPHQIGLGAFCDTGGITEALRLYLNHVCSGEYEEAVRYVAGEARIAHERTMGLPPGGLGKKLEKIDTKPLWQSGNIGVVKATYHLDGIKVNLIVTAYKTVQGWKLVQLN